MTPLQKGKPTTDFTDYTDESTGEIRVICEIRGKASFCSRVICGKFLSLPDIKQLLIPQTDTNITRRLHPFVVERNRTAFADHILQGDGFSDVAARPNHDAEETLVDV